MMKASHGMVGQGKQSACWVLLALGCLSVANCGTVQGKPAYLEEFEKRYTARQEASSEVEAAFYAAVEKQKCLVCHLPKDSGKADPKKRNRYGQRLSATMRQLNDLRGPAKTARALELLHDQRINPDDESSPTFGQRINDGHLPGDE